MKTKEILEFVQEIVATLQKKVKSQEDTNLPEASKAHTQGQLYEAGYILENVEKIIFKD